MRMFKIIGLTMNLENYNLYEILTFLRLESKTSTNEAFSSFLPETNSLMSVEVLISLIVSEFLNNMKMKYIEIFINVNMTILLRLCEAL